MTSVRATSRTLIALFAALALMLVMVLAAFSATSHNQAGSTWHRNLAGSTWHAAPTGVDGSTWH
jgi:hypothetical protein